MLNAADGDVLTDPVFGAQILKITGPAVGGSGGVEYGAPFQGISNVWNDGQDKITITFMVAGVPKFCDVTIGSKAKGVFRNSPAQLSWLAWTFSRDPAFQKIGYYTKNANGGFWTIARYDTGANADAPLGLFPKNLGPHGVNNSCFRTQFSDDMRWFCCHSAPTGPQFAVAWDTQTDTVTVKTLADMVAAGAAAVPPVTITDFNECNLFRDGSYIVLACLKAGGTGAAIFWDLATHTLTYRANVVPSHQETIGSLMFQQGTTGLDTYDPVTGTRTSRYSHSEVADSQNHSSGQWLQTATPILDRWVQPVPFSTGQPVNVIPGANGATDWIVDSGTPGVDAIYRAAVQFFSGNTNQTTARMNSGGVVLQAQAGNPNKWRPALSKSAGSGLGPGQWFYDPVVGAGGTVYVRPAGDVSPVTGLIGIFCPPACFDCIPLVRLGGASSSGGKAVHGFYHDYSNIIWWEANNRYGHLPMSQISPNGRYSLFKSNMGDRTDVARTDVFLAFPPVGQG